MRILISILMLMLMLYFPCLQAGEIIIDRPLLYVGDGGGQCIYTSIQAAIDEADPESEIRVTTDLGTFNENLYIDKNLVLKGGYSSCGLAQLDSRLDNSWTIVDGMDVSTVLVIEGDDLLVDISGFIFQNGIGTSISGGVSIIGNDSVVDLKDVNILSNQGDTGGGVFIYSGLNSPSTLNLTDTKIFFNTSTTVGGGLFCALSQVNILEGTGISGNTASGLAMPGSGVGGGVAAAECTINLRSGDSQNNSTVGIAFNNASDSGGGIYLEDSVLIFSPHENFTKSFAVNINNNLANTDGDDIGDGGGIAANQSIIEYLQYAYFFDNQVSDGNGGALFLDNTVVNEGFIDACYFAFDKCGVFENNIAEKGGQGIDSYGGAIYATENSDIGTSSDPINGYFNGNRADQGSAIYLNSDSEVNIQNSYFVQNGESGTGDTNDVSVVHLNGANTEASISFSTFADNFSNLVFSLENSPTLNLLASIINEPSAEHEVVSLSHGSSFSFGCSIFHEGESIGPISIMDQSVIDDDPGFVSPAEGNYHIRYDSIAVDRCSFSGLNIRDSDGDTRGIDIPNVSNGTGTYDVGADEYNDLIFANNFEDPAS